MDRWLDERLHSMQPQIAVMWIKERLCGLMRGYVIWRGVFNIRRDWETWREVAKQKESSKIHTCGEKLGCKTWDGVRDSIHEFYDRLCSLDLFICLKQGWPEFVSFFILYLLDPVAMHWCVQSFSAAYISESFTTRGVALCLSSIMYGQRHVLTIYRDRAIKHCLQQQARTNQSRRCQPAFLAFFCPPLSWCLLTLPQNTTWLRQRAVWKVYK